MNTPSDNLRLSSDQLLDINRICNDFEAEWQNGEPAVREYLQRADAACRPTLLIHLVQLDIEYRQLNGRQRSAADYLAMLPDLDERWLNEQLRSSSLDSTEINVGSEPVSIELEDTGSSLTGAELMDRVRKSHVIPEDQLQTVVFSSIDVENASAEDVGRALVESQQLTPFQLDSLRRRPVDPLVLGDYVLLEQIGQGGMGTVYRAVHRRMKRTVAVKVLRRDTAHADDMAKRFVREVEVAAKLSHPNIVAAFDAGEQHGLSYLVCEFIDGQNLSDIVRESGPLSLRDSAAIIRQTATAVSYAHQQGVIHRDIKPSNILVTEDGHAKLLDVGLARVQTDNREPGSELTTTGLIMGTVDFMAPEQAQNTRLADERSDIYSIGCTLYYLLTGAAPYGVGTNVERLLAHREQPIPNLCRLHSSVPRQLQTILERCMAKDPEERFPTAADAVAAIEALMDSDLPDLTLPRSTTDPEPQTVRETRSEPAADLTIPVAEAERVQNPVRATSSHTFGGEGSKDKQGDPDVPSHGPKHASTQTKVKVVVISAALVLIAVAMRSFFGGNNEPTVNTPPERRDLSEVSLAESRAYRDRWAAALPEGADVDLLGIHFVLIPPGDSATAAEYSLPKPIYMASTELTVGQFRQFILDTDHEVESLTVGGYGYFHTEPNWRRDVRFGWDALNELPVTEEMPATSLSHNDATAFCEWASEKTGRRIRLPDEREWEYASRCGRVGRWCFGDDDQRLTEFAWMTDNAQLQIHEVARLQPNAWNLFDIHGNEWEWCNSQNVEPGMAVLRGGGFMDHAENCTHEARQEANVSTTTNGAFRVVMDPE